MHFVPRYLASIVQTYSTISIKSAVKSKQIMNEKFLMIKKERWYFLYVYEAETTVLKSNLHSYLQRERKQIGKNKRLTLTKSHLKYSAVQYKTTARYLRLVPKYKQIRIKNILYTFETKKFKILADANIFVQKLDSSHLI